MPISFLRRNIICYFIISCPAVRSIFFGEHRHKRIHAAIGPRLERFVFQNNGTFKLVNL